MVALGGIEPAIYRLKAYYPKPLDDRAIKKLGAGSRQRSLDLTLDRALASPYNKPAHITIVPKYETVKKIFLRNWCPRLPFGWRLFNMYHCRNPGH